MKHRRFPLVFLVILTLLVPGVLPVAAAPPLPAAPAPTPTPTAAPSKSTSSPAVTNGAMPANVATQPTPNTKPVVVAPRRDGGVATTPAVAPVPPPSATVGHATVGTRGTAAAPLAGAAVTGPPCCAPPPDPGCNVWGLFFTPGFPNVYAEGVGACNQTGPPSISVHLEITDIATGRGGIWDRSCSSCENFVFDSPQIAVTAGHPVYWESTITVVAPPPWFFTGVTDPSVCSNPNSQTFTCTYTATYVPYPYNVPPPRVSSQFSPGGTLATTNVRPTYSWSAAGVNQSLATAYDLLIEDTTTGATLMNQWFSSADSQCPDGGNCILTPSLQLQAAQSYCWYLWTTNDGGLGPGWSPGLCFSIAAPVTATPTAPPSTPTPVPTTVPVSTCPPAPAAKPLFGPLFDGNFLQLRSASTDGGGSPCHVNVDLGPGNPSVRNWHVVWDGTTFLATTGFNDLRGPAVLPLSSDAGASAAILAADVTRVGVDPFLPIATQLQDFLEDLQGKSLSTSGQPYAWDSFQRVAAGGWGTADRGGSYTLWESAGTNADFSVNGSSGLIVNPSPGVAHTATLLGASARDVDMQVRVGTDKPTTGSGQYAYFQFRRVDNSNYYLARVRFDPNGSAYLQAAENSAGQTVNLGTEVVVPGYTKTANGQLWLRMQATGASPTRISMKAWPVGQSEPSGWQYTVTDSTATIQAPGVMGLMTYMSSGATNAPVRFTFNELRVVPVNYVHDVFGRTVSGGWGTADRGGTYTAWESAGSNADFSVSGNSAVIVNPAPGVTHSATLLGASARDLAMQVQVRTDKPATGSGQYVYFQFRRVDNSNYYLARVRFDPNGLAYLQAAENSAGQTVNLGSEVAVAGYIASANARLWLYVEATGVNPTTLSMKAWPVGQSEPSGWQYTVTDSTATIQVAGVMGLMTYMSSSATNAPVRFTFNDLDVRSEN